MKKLAVYTCKEIEGLMIYDHVNGCACWGKAFYYVPFEAIKKHWIFIGLYD